MRKISDKDVIIDQIYAIVRLVPEGRVTTFGAIANALGLKSGARFVGWALGNNYAHEFTPAHRVVNRVGLLTGKLKFPTPTFMEEALNAEGVSVINNKVQNFDQLFWNPIVHL